MTDTTPVTGSFFLDYVVGPLRERRLNSYHYSVMREVTYRRPHNIEYGPFLNWFNRFMIGDQSLLSEAQSLPDIIFPFARGARSGSNLGESWFLDPVWGGPRAHGLDPTQYDFALEHIAQNGKYWKVFMGSEKMWQRTMPTQSEVDFNHAPVGFKKEQPKVDHETEGVHYPWRAPEARRWPPAHGHH